MPEIKVAAGGAQLCGFVEQVKRAGQGAAGAGQIAYQPGLNRVADRHEDDGGVDNVACRVGRLPGAGDLLRHRRPPGEDGIGLEAAGLGDEAGDA